MEELEVNHVNDIHVKLSEMLEQRVRVKANMGRTRIVERMGTIKTVHPSVFIIEVDERRALRSRIGRAPLHPHGRPGRGALGHVP